MYTEVDRMILDSFVQCSYCGAKGNDIKCTSFTTTIATRGHFTDLDGHDHEHDTNRISAYYECSHGHKFEIQPLNSCWCGWKQHDESCGCKISVTTKKDQSFIDWVKKGLGLD